MARSGDVGEIGGVVKAWAVQDTGRFRDGKRPLALVERAIPQPDGREIQVRVRACGVCRTDLHLAEGDLPPRRFGIVPGHEIVGVVESLGPDVDRFAVGERVGIGWLRGTCGECRWCLAGRENLCPQARFTGWDADGGYAEYAIVNERFAYRIPDKFDDLHAAPLLCAGIIGYRALLRANLPNGGRLGIYGFGGSAHLTAQLATWLGATVHVFTRSPAARDLALRLGAASAGDAYDLSPEPLDSAILFAPVGDLVPVALQALDRGGTLAIAGIHLTAIPGLDYARDLFQERSVRSVMANTRADGEEYLRVAALADIEVDAVSYPFAAAGAAVADLAAGRVIGAAVIVVH
jgi:alcohol dehydrogenase, propanol-preferring